MQTLESCDPPVLIINLDPPSGKYAFIAAAHPELDLLYRLVRILSDWEYKKRNDWVIYPDFFHAWYPDVGRELSKARCFKRWHP